MEKTVKVNGREYCFPRHCATVICLDGSEPDYIDVAISAGLMPNVAAMKETGSYRIAHSVIPSFTNPNNLSIATGGPPSLHGISGNYHFNPQTGEEVMMNDVRFLTAPTIFSAFQKANARVAVITAKDKLRALLGAGLDFASDNAICFSSEKSNETIKSTNGISDASVWLGTPVPAVYSSELSEFVLAAGVKALNEFRPDIMYLSTTDYIQHKYAPDEQGAKKFYAMIDRYVGFLVREGASVVLTADHGMKAKHKHNGEPAVLYLQDSLDSLVGKGLSKVILPITDPYVVHHGALGSFASVYFLDRVDEEMVAARLRTLDGVMKVLSRENAMLEYDLPGSRIGDLILISDENLTFGTTESDHDLTLLKEPLRSHGGLTEQEVPFIVNKDFDIPSAPELRNFDAFYYATLATKY